LEKNVSDVVVILGTHYSGTSAVAGVLTRLGGTLPRTLVLPHAEDRQGSAKSARLTEFHDELLASAGTDWQDWRRFNPEWHNSSTSRMFKQRAKELFNAEFDAAHLAVVEDPRICRFVPFWLEVFGDANAAAHIVIPVRSPLDAARSLTQSHGLSVTHGLLLWLRHVLDVEFDTRSKPRAIFGMHHFASDWRRVTDRIARETLLRWPRMSDRSIYEIEQLIGMDYVDNETNRAELIGHSDVHEWAVGAYDALLELAVNPFSNSAHDRLDQIRDAFERSSQLFGRVLFDYEISLKTAQSEKLALEAAGERQIAAAQGELAVTRGMLTHVRTELAAARVSATEVVADIESRLRTANEQTRELQAVREQLAVAVRDLASARGALDELRDAYRNADKRLAELSGEVIDERNERLAAQARFAAAEQGQRATEEEFLATARELATMRERHDEMKLVFRRAELRTEELYRELEMTNLRHGALEDAADEELRAMRREIGRLGDEVARATEKSAAEHADNALFAAEVADLHSALAHTNEMKLDLEDRIETLEAEIGQTRDLLDARGETLHADNALFAAEVADLRRALAHTGEMKLDLEDRIETLEAEIGQTRDLLDARGETLHADNALFAAEVADLRRALAHNGEMKLDLEDRVETLKAEIGQTRDLLGARGETLHAHSKIFARMDKQARALAVRQAVERELAAAARAIRTKVPPLSFGMVFRDAQLRSPFLPRLAVRRRLKAERKEIESWGLFDAQYYLAQNPDVAGVGVDPFMHFLRHGILEDRDPHPLFSSVWYRIVAGESLGALPPFLHYLRHGRGSDRSPHPLFDARYYLESNKDVAGQGADPLTHFLNYGAAERHDPHPLVSMERLAGQPGFEGAKNPLIAYLTNRQLFKASPHLLFDGEAYLVENRDVAASGTNPLLHYCALGWRQGRSAHRLFAGDWYLANNPDVVASGVDPLHHYLRYGAFEQRSPHPLFDIRYYFSRYRDVRGLHMDALSHYVMAGASEGREATDKISLDLIREVVPAAAFEKTDPLSVFLKSGEIGISVPAHLAAGEVDRPTSVWPPVPDPVYWLPQRLRDYIVERYGEAPVGLYLYLMSVVERYGDAAEAFAESADLGILAERLKLMAKERRVPRSKAVDVSIIIPVYNNLVFTLTSVLSLLENATCHTYEIIIGDDRSGDATEAIFSATGGAIRHVRHEKNLGFLGNCNRCAELARGRFIVLLNNDTLALPGWLNELIEPLEGSEDIGLAGSKLLNADGTLQEAGGIFWSDGSAWNYGRNDNPRLPQYNYRKDVDYVSGASIALSLDLWRRLGGFDPEFTPAYCEDADLAFRIRNEGLRTLYAPHSALIHHEGKSHGRDTGSGIKAYQVVNRQKFLARWRGVLEAEHSVNGQNVFAARDRSRAKPHILLVDHYVPQWDRDAGSRAMFHLLRMFAAAGFQVSFWPDNLHEDRDYCRTLQNLGVEVIYSSAYIDEFDRWMATNGRFFDYALLSRPHIAIKYYQPIRMHSRCEILYYGHDIHHRRMELERATNDSPELARAIEEVKTQEFRNWALADVVLYPSVEERDVARGVLRRGRAEQVPLLGYLPEELEGARKNLEGFEARDFDELLFVGGSHPPNVDALLWFAREVMPLILQENPKTRLNFVGSTTNPEIARLESEAIVIRGRLSDAELAELYATAGLVVIPLRFGGGVKGKMVEALLHAIPIVSTGVGMQGLAPEESIAYVAEGREDFAKAVLDAQSSPKETRTRVERGLAFIEEAYSIEALRRAFAPFVEELKEKEGNAIPLNALTGPAVTKIWR
jgi:GT2 family glycosyltransferase